MSKLFKKSILGVVTIFIMVMISLALPLISYINPSTINSLTFTEARADFSGVKINDESVSLSGQWEFYWGEHIVSEESYDSTPDLYADVPSAWTLYEVGGSRLPNGGKASYRIVATDISSSQPILVSVNNFAGKCNVYIDRQRVFSNYLLPESKGADKHFVAYSSPIMLSDEITEHEIVIEVECDYSGGLTSLPRLSTYHTYRHAEVKAIALRFLLVGATVFFIISVFVLIVLGGRSGKQFWLILLCFAFLFRMLISNEGYMATHLLFGNLNYELMTTFVYASTYIIKLCMLMHVTERLGLKIRQELLVLIAATFLICAFVPYFLYDYIYVATSYMWLQSIAYVVDVFLVFKLAGAVVDKVKYSALYLVFYSITATAIIIDNFYINGFILGNLTHLMPVACVCFIGFMVCLYLASMVDAYKMAQKTAELERELSELNTTLMISQIQPHFLYNALNTIKYTIKKDPKVAESAIIKFSNYLRANMDSITQKEPIPISKELDHVKNYIDIEQLRFGERLHIEYDIGDVDFVIPALTIQPVVENAIKHGVNQKPEGGTVKISVSESDTEYMVCVEDDGVGYDVDEIKNDGRSHVGVSNITKRLKSMVNAGIDVQSTIGEGTTVTIKIPKKDEDKE